MLSDKDSCLGERGSPKRGCDEILVFFFVDFSSKRGSLCVLSDLRSRSGEKSSPKRDDEGTTIVTRSLR